MAGIENLDDLLVELRDLSLEDLIESTNDLTEANRLQHTLKKRGRAVLTGSTSALRSFTAATAEGTDGLGSLSTFMRSMSKTAEDNIPIIGGLLGGFGNMLAFATDKLDMAAGAFQDLSDVGMIGALGITGLADTALEAQMPIKKLSEMMKRESKDLSYVFGSALEGSRKYADFTKILQDGAHQQLRHLGLTTEQQSEAVVDFSKLQRKIGTTQEMSSNDLIDATVEYNKELTLLSMITGETKDALRKQRDEAMSDTRFRAYLQTLTEDQRRKALIADAAAGKLGRDRQLEFRSVVGGYITDTYGMQAAMNGNAQHYMALGKQFRNGSATMSTIVTTMNGVIRSSSATAEQQKYVAMASKDAGNVMGDVAGLFDTAKTKFLDVSDLEKLKQETLDRIDKTDKGTLRVVAYQAAMLKMTAVFENLVLTVMPADDVIGLFADKITIAANGITKWLQEDGLTKFGKDMMGVVDSIRNFLHKWGILDKYDNEAQGNEDYSDALVLQDTLKDDLKKNLESQGGATALGTAEGDKLAKGLAKEEMAIRDAIQKNAQELKGWRTDDRNKREILAGKGKDLGSQKRAADAQISMFRKLADEAKGDGNTVRATEYLQKMGNATKASQDLAEAIKSNNTETKKLTDNIAEENKKRSEDSKYKVLPADSTVAQRKQHAERIEKREKYIALQTGTTEEKKAKLKSWDSREGMTGIEKGSSEKYSLDNPAMQVVKNLFAWLKTTPTAPGDDDIPSNTSNISNTTPATPTTPATLQPGGYTPATQDLLTDNKIQKAKDRATAELEDFKNKKKEQDENKKEAAKTAATEAAANRKNEDQNEQVIKFLKQSAYYQEQFVGSLADLTERLK